MGKRLVDTRTIRRRMSLPDNDRINEAITEIAKAVSDDLESALRTTLGFQARNVDLFYLRDATLHGSRFGEKFMLLRGLVTEDAINVKVETAPRRNGFLTGQETSVLDLRNTDEAVVDNVDQFVLVTPESRERGLVTVQDFRLLRTYVQITYDAGIAEDRTKSDLFLQSDQAFSVQGAPTLTFADADPDTITRSGGDWAADGFRVGDAIVVTGTVSNDDTYVLAAVTTTVLTLATADVLVAEAVVAGVRVAGIQSVPPWLKELAAVSIMLELTISDAVAGAFTQQRERSQSDRVRPERLERKIALLLDEHTRYEPGANRPVC